MKTTVDIPDPLFREAKAVAARHRLTLRTFITEALREKVAGPIRHRGGWPAPPPPIDRRALRSVAWGEAG